MPYRLDEVKENAIHSWAYTALGLDADNVIWDRPNAPRPDPPYALLNILSGPRKTGRAAEERYKELDTFVYAMRKEFTLTVGIYGGDGYLKQLGNLLDSLEKPSALTTLRQAGLACWGFEPPVDLSTLLDTQFEDRAAVDIFFAYGEAMEDDAVGRIESVNMVAKFAIPPPPPDENTVILYKLDNLSGVVVDSSSNGLDGINYSCLRGNPGVYDKSFDFAFLTSYIDANSKNLSDLWRSGLGDTGTIDFWFRALKESFWGGIGGGAGGYFFHFDKTKILEYVNSLKFYHDGTDLILKRFVSGEGTLILEAKIALSNLDLGLNWHYYRVTWTTAKLEIYIDDELKAYDEDTANPWQNRSLKYALIGAFNLDDVIRPHLDGRMDYFRISDIVRGSSDGSVRKIDITV